MNDLELDVNTHDLVIQSGSFNLLNSDARVARQTLAINLQFFQGEWFLDLSYGVPYFQEILRKGSTKQLADTIIQNTIRNSYNIQSIERFNSNIVGTSYTILDFVGTTVDGEIISITNQQLT